MTDVVRTAIRTVRKGVRKNSTTILFGVGLGGLLSSVALFVSATIKVMDAVDKRTYELYLEDPISKITGNENISYGDFMSDCLDYDYTAQTRFLMLTRDSRYRDLLVSHYGLPTVMTIASVAALVYGNRLQAHRTALVLGMYEAAQQTVWNYKDAVMHVSPRKGDEIVGAANQLSINQHPAKIVHNIGGGDDICFEPLTGRYFWSSVETIKRLVNEFNFSLMTENFKTLNELYYDLGLPQVDIGEHLGWDAINGLVEVSISANLTHDQEHPCLVVTFPTSPKWSI